MPNRTLKESIRESESINMLSHAAECTWYRLITYADDFGLFKANVRLINRALFPLRDYTDEQVSEWLSELEAAEMIAFYTFDGKAYGTILNWLEYNTPRNNKPKHPQPTEDKAIQCTLQTIENNCTQMNANVLEVEVEVEVESRGCKAPARKNIQKQKPINPTQEEVTEYFKSKGFGPDLAKRAWEYYEAGGWKDSQGKPVKSWKQKMLAVWLKDENRPAQPQRETYIKESVAF